MLIHFSTYININQNAMNDVTSIYLVRDMHKTVTIFLCMNLKKNHTALCILQKKERKKRLVLGGPLRFSLTFQPYSQGSQPGDHCITNTSFLLQDRRKLWHEPISKIGPMITKMGRKITHGQCCQSRTKSTSELLFCLEQANIWFT